MGQHQRRAAAAKAVYGAGQAADSRPDVPSAGTILAALTDDRIDGEQYDQELPARQRDTLY